MWDPYAEFETAVLPNGLEIHAAHWPGRPWVKMGFVVHSGGRHDESGLEGTAHFVEHMVSRNAMLPYQDIKNFFESLGGEVNLGETSYHATKYSFAVPASKEYVVKALNILGSMLLGARLSNFIDSQRQVIQGEFQRSYSMPIVHETLWRRDRHLYGSEHYLGRTVSLLGYPDSIARISEDDLQSFYHTHYVPANISVVCVGGMKLDEIVRYIEQSSLAAEKRGNRQPLLQPLTSFPKPTETRYVFETSKHIKTAEPEQSIAFETHAVIPEAAIRKPAVWMASEILNKLLFMDVREARGWTYNIRSSSIYHQELRVFSITSKALAVESLDQIDYVVNEIIDSIQYREDLFEEIKHGDLAESAMLDVTARGIRNAAVDDLIAHQRIQSISDEDDFTRALSMDDVAAVIPWLRPERRYTLLRVP